MGLPRPGMDSICCLSNQTPGRGAPLSMPLSSLDFSHGFFLMCECTAGAKEVVSKWRWVCLKIGGHPEFWWLLRWCLIMFPNVGIAIINHPPVITVNGWYKPSKKNRGLWHCYTHVSCLVIILGLLHATQIPDKPKTASCGALHGMAGMASMTFLTSLWRAIETVAPAGSQAGCGTGHLLLWFR